MEKSKDSNRRDFLVNMSMAAAALTLNSAFGLPVETERGTGRLFVKLPDDNIHGDALERLKNGKMESLAIKFDISFDKKRWQTLNTNISDKTFMKQLTEFAQNGKTNRRIKKWKRQ
jgi:homogentisate 1,2-dioxygenase